ncbi:hypothetical protein [Microbacterium sp.]|uniref:hypothetical protein n=1 Tax=Microbacterium sp. TaxID=51671 RepID=UPI003A8BA027
MSTERPGAGRAARFGRTFAVVAVLLAAVGLGGAAVTTAQGPRVTHIEVDPATSITVSGSRVILTLTQAVADVAPEQVTVTPDAGFRIDTAGRSIGIRFDQPLWDETEYTIRIDGVEALGGGPVGRVEEAFTTPALQTFLLRRGGEDDDDTIFRTDLTGSTAVPVYTDEHIEDYRATGSHLIVSTVDEDGLSHLVVTDLDGESPRELALPGDGYVADLQAADRGARIGYTFSDADIGADHGRESVLYTTSLTDPDAAPVAFERAAEARTVQWRFVPGTDRVLIMTFDGALTLAAPDGAEPVALGSAVSIHGIAEGSTVAFLDTVTGPIGMNLTTTDEEPLAETGPERGQTGAVVPVPGGDTLRVLSTLDGFTVTSTEAALVDPAGQTRSVFSVAPEDALLHTCVSPSGRYAAFLVAPGAVDNPYDGYQLPLPGRVQTHIVALADGGELVALDGFDISWCETAPSP